MSLLSMQGGATGTGTVTLLAPVTNTDRTLTLPDVTDTVAGIAATQTLTNKSIVATQLTGTIAAARLPAGSVLQVVSTAVTSTASVSGTTFQDIGLSASITPTSSSSKILVLLSITLGGTNNAYAAVNLVRNSTDIIKGADGAPGIECTFGITNAGSGNSFWDYGALPYTFNYLDSPATTSATTYKVQVRPQLSGGYTVWMNRSLNLGDDNQFRTASTITLMEIAA